MENTASFLLAALLIELTPGPNMTYLALVSALEGRRAGLATTAGIALGLAGIGLAATAGLTALIEASPLAFAVLRWGGVAYLFWLAVEAWIGAREVSPERAPSEEGVGRHFRRGLVINLLNPKAGLFFVAVLPGFVTTEDDVLARSVTLILLYVALATAVHGVIVGFAGSARRLLEDPRRQRLARRTFSLLLGAVALWFFIETRS